MYLTYVVEIHRLDIYGWKLWLQRKTKAISWIMMWNMMYDMRSDVVRCVCGDDDVLWCNTCMLYDVVLLSCCGLSAWCQFTNMHLKMQSAKCPLFCTSLDVLTHLFREQDGRCSSDYFLNTLLKKNHLNYEVIKKQHYDVRFEWWGGGGGGGGRLNIKMPSYQYRDQFILRRGPVLRCIYESPSHGHITHYVRQ